MFENHELCIVLFDSVPGSWKIDLVACVGRLVHILRVVLESKLKELENAAEIVGVDLMENAMVRAQLMEVLEWMKGELVDEFLGVLNVVPQKMSFVARIRSAFRCCMNVDAASPVGLRPAFGSSCEAADAAVVADTAAGTGLTEDVPQEVISEAEPAAAEPSAAPETEPAAAEPSAAPETEPVAAETVVEAEPAAAPEVELPVAREPAHPEGLPVV